MNGIVARKRASKEANPVKIFENIPLRDGLKRTYMAIIFPISPSIEMDVNRIPSVTYSNISSRTADSS